MLALAYHDLYHLNPLEARKLLVQAFHDTGENISLTARLLHCSRNTVRKFVRRYKQGLPLTSLSRRPHHSPTQTPPAFEKLVAKERKKTGFGPLRLRHLLQSQYHLLLSPYTIRNLSLIHI